MYHDAYGFRQSSLPDLKKIWQAVKRDEKTREEFIKIYKENGIKPDESSLGCYYLNYNNTIDLILKSHQENPIILLESASAIVALLHVVKINIFAHEKDLRKIFLHLQNI